MVEGERESERGEEGMSGRKGGGREERKEKG